MPPEESPYPVDWLRIAEKDLDRVNRALRDGDSEASGFFLQQALEKFFKAYLLARGWKLRRIHDLEALLDEAATYDQTLEQFRAACQRITDWYMLERYPLVAASGPTTEEVRESLLVAQPLITKLSDATS